jgi:hypothetical protein
MVRRMNYGMAMQCRGITPEAAVTRGSSTVRNSIAVAAVAVAGIAVVGATAGMAFAVPGNTVGNPYHAIVQNVGPDIYNTLAANQEAIYVGSNICVRNVQGSLARPNGTGGARPTTAGKSSSYSHTLIFTAPRPGQWEVFKLTGTVCGTTHVVSLAPAAEEFFPFSTR